MGQRDRLYNAEDVLLGRAGGRVDAAYPPEWPAAAEAEKRRAGWRCRRCGHPAERPGAAMPCDGKCRQEYHPEAWQPSLFERQQAKRQRVLTTHHLDGDKANLAGWNLRALCQVCHLAVQPMTHKLFQFYLVREATSPNPTVWRAMVNAKLAREPWLRASVSAWRRMAGSDRYERARAQEAER